MFLAINIESVLSTNIAIIIHLDKHNTFFYKISTKNNS
jgi:hypothetical protein